MNLTTAIELVKARIGISSNVRDAYLTAIVQGVISELEREKGIILKEDNPHHLMFVVDYSAWRYENKGSESGMPRHLQFRMHNLVISAGGQDV